MGEARRRPDAGARSAALEQRGLGVDATKSGYARRPHLSRRLYRALRSLYTARWEPGPDARIIERHYHDLDKLTLRRALKRAGLPSRSLQNLRATCSSLLKQWGVSPEYVRAAIGHESEAVATAHYDQLNFTRYREPERLHPGDTPMDLFERLDVAPEADIEPTESHSPLSDPRNH